MKIIIHLFACVVVGRTTIKSLVTWYGHSCFVLFPKCVADFWERKKKINGP